MNVIAIHRADHLKKKKQNLDYYPTYNLYGFAWAFKIWILKSYPNSKKWWSKMDNVLPHALAWSNVTKLEKNDYNRLFGPGLVDEDFNVSQDDGVGEATLGEGCFDSEGGATNPESNKDKPPMLADVLDEVRALRKEVALVNPNGNHNAVNQGLSGSANHPMSTCSRPDIDNGEVAGHVIGIHKAGGKNDSPNGNQNGVKKGLSCSANDPLSTCSGADILDGEVVGALMGIYKADGKNDSLNVNHNHVNKGLSCSANDPMSTCSSPDMDNGKVVVAGMGIHKADGQNEIPNANDNAVNQGIIGSANDLMLDVLIQVACDGMGIDKANGNNDYTDSQREPSTLDVLVDEFADDYMDVLNNEESIPNYSLDDMKLQDEEEKLISTPAPINHQEVDELIDVHQDKTTVLQENVKDVSGEPKMRPISELMTLEVFVEQLSRPHNCIRDKLIESSGGSMIDYYSNGVRYPVAWRDVEKKHWCLAELHMSTGENIATTAYFVFKRAWGFTEQGHSS
ncbi:hypothetical protein Tco_1504354 [Tanacetum coccineum]